MKTFLINTVTNYVGSPQGPARVYAYARRAGLDVTFLNLNHDVFSHVLSARTLSLLWQAAGPSRAGNQVVDRSARDAFGALLISSSRGEIVSLLADVLEARGPADEYAQRVAQPRPPLRPALRRRLTPERIAFELSDHLPEVTARIGAAQAEMDRLFLRQSAADFLARLRVLLCGKAIVDALHYPALLDLGLGFQGSEWSLSFDEVLAATRHERHNWILPYLRSHVVPRLVAAQPDLVGLSLTHYSEVIPSLTLARLVKEALPETHIVLGGAVMSYMGRGLARNAPVWDVIDSIIIGPGERPFVALAEAIESRASLSKVPQLLHKGCDQVMLNERAAALPADELPTPEYVDLRPGAVLGLETSADCYWGRCAFCVYSKGDEVGDPATPSTARTRSLERVLTDLETLASHHDPALVWLTDHSVPPARLAAIAEWNRTRREPVPFAAFIRLDKAFESEAFCRKLAAGGFLGGQAGLEAGTPRVNALIAKGIDLAAAPAILRNLHSAGLRIHLYTVVGFPGETEQEAWATFEFVRRHRRYLALDWHVFWLGVVEGSPLARDPARYGVSLFHPAPDGLVPYCGYVPHEGLSASEARRLSVVFEDRLARHRHPAARYMDNELYKLFLLKEGADAFRSGARALDSASTPS